MTASPDIWRKGVAELTSDLRAGLIDPVSLLEICLDRIARLDPALNSMVAVDEAGARAAARDSAARFKAGAPLSALDGVPITIKDNLLVRGMPATWGSHAYADFRPDKDELPVERLRAAGALLVGKTNVPELTLEGYTSNLLFGATRNPWSLDLTPGGSSGGAAASVAAGLVPAAIGTDGGGSIRRPASHTGLVGFKPSTGRIPRADGFPETLHDCEVIGTLTRSVADAALLDGVLSGPDGRDRRSAALPAVPLGWGAGRLRILYAPRFDDAPLDPEVAAVCDAAARQLGSLGHSVETAPVFFDRGVLDEIWRVIGRAGVARVARLTGGRLLETGGPSIQAMAREGAELAAADYVEALAGLAAFRREIVKLFERCDLIFTPSAAALPWPAGEAFPPRIDGRPVGPRGHAIYTGWVNVAGCPAIGLPLGLSNAGLPIGGQFVGPFGSDAALLGFAANFETARAMPHAWPPFATTPV